MIDRDLFQLSAKATRKWREMEIQQLFKNKFDDLSYRPQTGMSSLGWVLAHQAAVYDYSLNMLILQGPAKNERLFKLYTPGTSGDWDGTSFEEIQAYFDSSERDLLEWLGNAGEEELDRQIEKGTAPSFFVGMTIREVIMNTFTHLNYHTGHITAIRKEQEQLLKER